MNAIPQNRATAARGLAVLFLLLSAVSTGYAQASPSREELTAEYERRLKQAHQKCRARNDAAAVPDAVAAYQLAVRLYGENSPSLYPAVDILFQVYTLTRQFDLASKYGVQALDLAVKAHGKESHQYAITLQGVAALQEDLGNIKTSLQFHTRAVEILRKQAMPAKACAIDSMRALSRLYTTIGNYTEAQKWILDLWTFSTPLLPFKNPRTAQVLLDTGHFFMESGNYIRAESLFISAYEIYNSLYGPRHPDTAFALMDLGVLYRRMREYTYAFRCQNDALAIYEAVYGKEGLETVGSRHRLSSLLMDTGEFEKAYEVQAEAKAILEKHKATRSMGAHLNNLGWACLCMGRLDEAQQWLEKAYALDAAKEGASSESCANILCSLATVFLLKEDFAKAATYAASSNELYEKLVRHFAITGSEAQKIGFLEKLKGKTHFNIHLALKDTRPNSALSRTGLLTVLRRKARAVDLMLTTLSALEKNPNPRVTEQLRQLADVRTELAALSMRHKTLDPKSLELEQLKLQRKIEDLEIAICQGARELSVVSRSVDIPAVAQALPADTLLVEYVFYRPLDLKVPRSREETIPARYAAFCLTPDNKVQAADLGPADDIDALVRKLRREIARSNMDTFSVPARELYAKLITPLLPMAAPYKRLLVSPDSRLHLIPFTVLMDPDGKFLLETKAISYLSSGRDVLSVSNSTPAKGDVLLMADPDYSVTPAAVTNLLQPSRSADLENVSFPPLPGTAREAEALNLLMPRATLCLGKKATESYLKTVHSPLLLHIATHGFFLASPLPDASSSRGLKKKTAPEASGPLQLPTPEPVAPPKDPTGWTDIFESGIENSLLRSGLALAGANHAASTGGDGILTALEASRLDLAGTRMVVLSACETGLGDIRNGEGVMGLRRAFLLAGSQTQVMSLWKVHDDATQKLMQNFYRHLKERLPKPDAMRQAQLDLMKSEYKHPYYWAAFTVSGDWRAF